VKQLEVEELREHITDAIREVQQGGTIELVLDGDVVALLVPAQSNAAQMRAAVADLDALRAEIASHTSGPVDVTQILSEMRGRLD
jgi:antitoxin (DNA-binding transcriptional repressor) of toxin-antitoxin stability system